MDLSLDTLVSSFQAPTPVEIPEAKPPVTTPVEEQIDELPKDDATGAPEEVTPPEDKEDSGELSITAALKAEYLADEETDFEPTYEGVQTLVKTVSEKSEARGREAVVNELFAAYPEMDDYLTYRMQGGDPAKYFEVLSQSSAVGYDAETEKGQKQIVTDFLKQTLDAEEIAEQLIILEETGKLKEKADKYLPKLEEKSSTSQKALLEQQAKQAEETEKRNTEYWNGIKATVDSGKLANNTVVPTNERKAFFDWLAIPTKDGISQQQADWAAMSPDQKLMFQYMIFKKGDLSKLAVRQQTTSKVDQQVKNLAPGSRMAGGKKEETSAARIALTGGAGLKFS